MVSGDNLASHYLGGFKAPSGALRKCRHCMATANDMETKVKCVNYNSHILNMTTFKSQFDLYGL